MHVQEPLPILPGHRALPLPAHNGWKGLPRDTGYPKRVLSEQTILTTKEAAAYCGFRSPMGLRKAAQRGAVKWHSREGKDLRWEVAELHRFLGVK